ncbi:GTP-binding elongation factor Tu family, putative [Trypanosoma equiperdum]|uniref:GTP-binding elongation factor Tu family, putative n=1 Tax=Trypanosoma equiperdum TaxID=5694 RepID=A0A1G4IE91_TRYEQ|nr:GTP-binding elongation factor Tu family, putative [Trypanosoma equiperdum]
MADGSHDREAALFLVLSEPEAMTVGQWLKEVAEKHLMPPVVHAMLYNVSEACGKSSSNNNNSNSNGRAASGGSEGNGCFQNALTRVLNEFHHSGKHGVPMTSMRVLVVALFWDGQSESAKAEFARLRELADETNKQTSDPQVNADKANNSGSDGKQKLPSLIGSNVHIVLQALNAKKSNEKLVETLDAVVCSLRKKLQSACGPSEHVDPTRIDAAASRRVDKVTVTQKEKGSQNGTGDGGSGNNVIGVEDLSDSAVAGRVEEGQGECFIVISGTTMEEFQKRVWELKASAARIGVGCSPVLAEPREVQTSNSGTKTKVFAQEFLVRQGASVEQHIEMRIAMCGNVDSGKSTLTSVLTRGCRDNGRGSARAFVFKHKHEAATGRTSSVSENHLGFSEAGEVVNYVVAGAKHSLGGVSLGEETPNDGGGGGGGGDGPIGNKPVTINSHQLGQEVAAKSSKVLTLYDLAGHERYLKTTVLGMTRNIPDYACVVISANNGIQRMTKEHVALCLALKIPFFVVITRIDSTPENIRQETLASVHKLLKVPTVRKLPYPVRRVDDVVLSAKNLRNDRITPIFEISNVSGEGLQSLVRFLNLLPMRKDWRNARQLPREMVIDSTFFVAGVGTVVGGIVTQGVFNVNDAVLLGPDASGGFRTVQIKSIHVKGVEQQRAVAGCDASFCLKKEKRRGIRKGNILTDPKHPVEAYWQFEADVVILYHSTTILVNYEPVIHSTTVRQSARIVFVEKEVLRTGDRSLVRFHFLYRPEFMKVGQQLIFREGRTKGIGTVTNLIGPREGSLLAKRLKHKET